MKRIYRWFDIRLGISDTWVPMLRHPVPRELAGPLGWWYVFGSASLTLFIIQILTGIGLALTYVPSAGQDLQQEKRQRRTAEDIPPAERASQFARHRMAEHGHPRVANAQAMIEPTINAAHCNHPDSHGSIGHLLRLVLSRQRMLQRG